MLREFEARCHELEFTRFQVVERSCSGPHRNQLLKRAVHLGFLRGWFGLVLGGFLVPRQSSIKKYQASGAVVGPQIHLGETLLKTSPMPSEVSAKPSPENCFLILLYACVGCVERGLFPRLLGEATGQAYDSPCTCRGRM